MPKQLACKKCNGDYIVGEGGRLECRDCGYIAGDISLLFKNTGQDRRFDFQAPTEYTGTLQKSICKP